MQIICSKLLLESRQVRLPPPFAAAPLYQHFAVLPFHLKQVLIVAVSICTSSRSAFSSLLISPASH